MDTLGAQILFQIGPILGVPGIVLLEAANDLPDGVDVEGKEDSVDEDDEVAIQDLVRVARCHVSISDGGGCLEGPIDGIFIPYIPVGVYFKQV